MLASGAGAEMRCPSAPWCWRHVGDDRQLLLTPVFYVVIRGLGARRTALTEASASGAPPGATMTPAVTPAMQRVADGHDGCALRPAAAVPAGRVRLRGRTGYKELSERPGIAGRRLRGARHPGSALVELQRPELNELLAEALIANHACVSPPPPGGPRARSAKAASTFPPSPPRAAPAANSAAPPPASPARPASATRRPSTTRASTRSGNSTSSAACGARWKR